MNRLTKNKIEISWESALIGYKNDWISKEEIQELASKGELSPIDDNIIIELFTKDNSKQEFIEVLKKVVRLFSYNSSEKRDEITKKAEANWRLAFLLDIVDTTKSIKEKLIDISVLWANLSYPKEWNNFIYYMPAQDQMELGEQAVYEKLLDFIAAEGEKLKSQLLAGGFNPG